MVYYSEKQMTIYRIRAALAHLHIAQPSGAVAP